jgi:hypothetical protein
VVPLHRRIEFTYTDKSHDAEAVAVDPKEETVLILTKRDRPPLLFSLPLAPPDGTRPVVAVRLGTIDTIPPPTAEDLLHRYGVYRSQPTAMDMDPGSTRAVVLTYKHAYIFSRAGGRTWAESFGARPRIVRLSLLDPHLSQREAACFSRDGGSLMVTSEGAGAPIYRLSPP